jgi:TRAP-type uncharacterized transport system substrate-binding protein
MERKSMFKVVIVFFVVFAFLAGPVAVSAADKEVTRIMILGGRLGDPWFVLSQALANFVNKQSDWLRLEVVATPGASAGAEIARKDYKKYIFISPYYGMKFNPTDKRLDNYDKERIIGLCSANVHIWITYDKNLKTGKDLAGKKVFIGRPGGARTAMEMKVLEENGVLDKVKLMHGGFGGGRNALRDGLADLTPTALDYILPLTFKKGAFVEDLETRKPIYYPNLQPRAMQLKNGMIPVRVPAGALDKKTQTEEFFGAMDPIYWCADARQDPAIVKEVTRILYKNAAQLKDFHVQGNSLTHESIPTWVISPEQMHPAAMEAYKELGAKVQSLIDILP